MMLFLCSCSDDSAKKNWKLTYGMTGGVAGYMDRVEINPDGKAQYFKGREKLKDFELLDEITAKVSWIANRDDVIEKVGVFKGGTGVMDDIKYTLIIQKNEKTYKIEWDSRSKHPAVLDEIRPTLDEIIGDARKLVDQ